MIRTILATFALTLILTGCGVTDNATRLPMPDWQTDPATCSWHWRDGDGIGLWAETCVLNGASWQVDWDAELGAFVTRRDDEVVGIAVQGFAVPIGGGIVALSQTLIAAGHLQSEAACTWQTAALRPVPRTMTVHVLTPIDSAALAPTATGEVPDPVCGIYGASTHGVRYFITDLRWPDRAIFVEEGQERPLFDPASITALQ